jgi:hypothetical protein
LKTIGGASGRGCHHNSGKPVLMRLKGQTNNSSFQQNGNGFFTTFQRSAGYDTSTPDSTDYPPGRHEKALSQLVEVIEQQLEKIDSRLNELQGNDGDE